MDKRDRLTRRDPDGRISVDDPPAALEKLAAYEDGVEQIRERLRKEVENKKFAHDEAARIEYAGLIYGLRNALLTLQEGQEWRNSRADGG